MNQKDKQSRNKALQFLTLCEKHGFDENKPIQGFSAKEMRDKLYKAKQLLKHSE